MKHLVALACLALTLICTDSQACLNYYVLDSSGHRHPYDEYPLSGITVSARYKISRVKELEKKLSAAPAATRYQYVSNYCAALIEAGRFKEAIPMLERLVKEQPEEYEVNANLAVAYELNGQLTEALSYLKKSMAISPDSHRSSEWFHVKVLEAAIVIRDTGKDVRDMDVLQLQDRAGEATETGAQLSYQLHERLPLTGAPNALLHKVLEESADYYQAHLSLEWAIELYAIAIGYADDASAAPRLWEKINLAHEKLIEFREQGKEGTVSKYLYKPDWKNKITALIGKWRNYKPYYYNQPVTTAY
ncbi:MAG: tetratricopeptide repeat protein [Chitinophagaceae bacterium]